MKKLDFESQPGVVLERPGVFRPTATTRTLARSASRILAKSGSILDLGCGSGIIGLSLALEEGADRALAMSDVSPDATALALENTRVLGMSVDVRTGSLFSPWVGEVFDSIVSDVSGVAPELGERFGWFDGVPNESGTDGTTLAVQVIRQANKYLAYDGTLVFPIISLSAEKRILDEAMDAFESVTLVEEVRLPLGMPVAELEEIRTEFPFIRIDSVGGIACFFTSTYACQTPKGKV
jgi:cyclopropane fatty-acyl-phospholipid synthase-like methyltransferase